jgi:hypothetical protein
MFAVLSIPCRDTKTATADLLITSHWWSCAVVPIQVAQRAGSHEQMQENHISQEPYTTQRAHEVFC